MRIRPSTLLFTFTVLLLIFAMPSSAAERVTSEEYGDIWPFPNDTSGLLYCKELGGGRKAVWLNGKSTYALNGQAMSWMVGANLTGVDGGPVKKGRDVSKNYKGLHQLIQDGLKLCK